MDGTVTVSGPALIAVAAVLLFLLQAGLAAWVRQDARRRPGRVPSLDAGMAFLLPVIGVYAYWRSVKDASLPDHQEAPQPMVARAGRRRERGGGVAAELMPQLTEQVRLARAEAADARTEAVTARAEADRLRAELKALREQG